MDGSASRRTAAVASSRMSYGYGSTPSTAPQCGQYGNSALRSTTTVFTSAGIVPVSPVPGSSSTRFPHFGHTRKSAISAISADPKRPAPLSLTHARSRVLTNGLCARVARRCPAQPAGGRMQSSSWPTCSANLPLRTTARDVMLGGLCSRLRRAARSLPCETMRGPSACAAQPSAAGGFARREAGVHVGLLRCSEAARGDV